MRLQKQLSRKVSGTTYPKYVLVVPPKIIEKAKLKGGDELEVEIDGKKIIISPKRKQIPS